jgi:DNA-directed RNA polymerase specialized sigma subunit
MIEISKQEYEAELAMYRELVKDAKHKKKEYISKIPARNLDIARLRFREGLTLAKIGERYGISRGRVHHILNSL